jgi:hypothetical protein
MARPWLSDRDYHRWLGGDPLANPANVTLIEELLGVAGTKPFECVGTPEETAAAIHLARKRGHLLPHGVMTAFAAACTASLSNLETTTHRALTRSDEHELSRERVAQLDDYLARH